MSSATVTGPAAGRQQPLGRRVGRWLSRNAIRIYAVIGFTYLFIPVAYTLAFSFNDSGKSNIAWKGFTLDKWKNPCGAPDVCTALGNSLKIGLIATLIATLLGTMVAFALARHRFRGRTGTNLTIFLPMATPEVVLGASLLALAISYPLAYAIAFKSGRLRNILLVLVVAPFFVSFLLRTVAWKQILADNSWVLDALRWLHLLSEDGRIFNTPLAVVIGITYNFLPFMILPIYASLERVDPRLMEAAGDLYANGLTTLRKVTFPLSMPGVVAGTLLTFIPAAGDYVNATLLGDPVRTTMVGNVIDSRFLKVVDYPTAAVLSVTLMASILLLVFFYIRRAGTEELV